MAALALVMSARCAGPYRRGHPLAYGPSDERATGSYETAPMRFWFGGVYLRACRLNGLLDECQRATTVLSELARDAPAGPTNLVFLQGMPRCCAANWCVGAAAASRRSPGRTAWRSDASAGLLLRAD